MQGAVGTVGTAKHGHENDARPLGMQQPSRVGRTGRRHASAGRGELLTGLNVCPRLFHYSFKNCFGFLFAKLAGALLGAALDPAHHKGLRHLAGFGRSPCSPSRTKDQGGRAGRPGRRDGGANWKTPAVVGGANCRPAPAADDDCGPPAGLSNGVGGANWKLGVNVRKCAVHQHEVALRSHLQNLAVTPGFVLRELLDRFLGLVESARGSRDDDFVSVAVDLDAGARVGLDLLEGRAAFADDNAVVGLWDDDLFARGLLGFLAQDNPGLVDRRKAS